MAARPASAGGIVASTAWHMEQVVAAPELQPFSQEGAKDMSQLGTNINF